MRAELIAVEVRRGPDLLKLSPAMATNGIFELSGQQGHIRERAVHGMSTLSGASGGSGCTRLDPFAGEGGSP
jgi:hypothetical protein